MELRTEYWFTNHQVMVTNCLTSQGLSGKVCLDIC